MSIEPDRPADDLWVGTILALPKRMADHGHRSACAPVVIGHEDASAQGLYAKRTEEFTAHVEALHRLLLAASCQVESGMRPGECSHKYVLPVPELFPDRIG